MLVKAARNLLAIGSSSHSTRPLLPKNTQVNRHLIAANHQTRFYSIKFTKDDKGEKADKKQNEKGPKSLPDPRGYLGKAFDLLRYSITQLLMPRTQNGMTHRILVLLGLQKEEPRWFNRIFGSKEPE